MSLFDKLKNKRSSLQEKKDDTTGKRKKPIKVNIQDLQKKISKNPKLKNVGVKTTDTIKQSEVSKQAKKFTKKINKKNINRPEGVIGDTYVSTTKKGKIRSAKKVNPTLKKSISQVKGDIEFKQSLKKAGASGDVSDTAPKKIRDYVTKKREIRADKLGLKDPFKIDTSKAAKENQKIFKNIGTGSKGKSLPVSGFGKGITKGQANVKDLQKSSFKITQPKDVKVPASFLDFSRKINKLKTDVAKTASSTPRTVTKKYKPTTTVKQSEVSKKAKAFTNQISQQKKAKTNKVVDLATKKQQSKLSKAAKDITQQRDDAIVKREKLRSVKGKKDVKDIRLTNRKVGDLDKLSQTTKKAASGVGNPNAPVKYNKMTAGTEFIKNNQKTKTKLVTNPVPKKTGSQIMKQNEIREGPTGRVKTKGPQLLDDITVKNTPREIRFAKTSSKVLAKTPKALKPVARPASKGIAAANPGAAKAVSTSKPAAVKAKPVASAKTDTDKKTTSAPVKPNLETKDKKPATKPVVENKSSDKKVEASPSKKKFGFMDALFIFVLVALVGTNIFVHHVGQEKNKELQVELDSANQDIERLEVDVKQAEGNLERTQEQLTALAEKSGLMENELTEKNNLLTVQKRKLGSLYATINNLKYNDNFKEIISLKKNVAIDDTLTSVSEENLFHIINHCKLFNLKIYLTSSIDLNNHKFKLKDLYSRLRAFYYINIEKPDDEMCKMFMTKLFYEKQIIIKNKEIFEYIINRVNRSYNDIYLFVEKIDKLSLEKKRQLTIPLIKEII